MKALSRSRAVCAALVLSGLAAVAAADTPVGGTISTSTIWHKIDSPFLLTSNVFVEGASTPVLTIEAGVTVKIPSNMSIYVGNSANGTLLAVGTAALPIIFTSVTGTTAGSWEAIRLQTHATSASHLSYVTVRYAGQNGVAGLTIDTSSPTVDHSTFQNSANAGIRILGASAASISTSTITANATGVSILAPAAPSLQTLTITNNTGYPIVMDSKVTLATVSGITATGNGTNGVQLTGAVDVNTTWKNFGLTYYPLDYIYINGSTTPVLTVSPGLTVKFQSGRSFIVGSSTPGNLQAVGTAAQPIVFTTASASPVAGSWEGIRFYNQTSPLSKLAYVTLSYAGQNSFGGIYIESCSPIIQNSTIQNNAYVGVRILGTSAPAISSSTITANPTGLLISYPSTPSLTSLTITNNTGFPISMEAKVALAALSGITLTGNGTNGLQVTGNIDVTTTWKNYGLTYYPPNYVYVGGTGTPVFTIDPGVTVKFTNSVSIIVGNNGPGNLQAVGTSSQPIILTTVSASPVPGSWEGIRFYSQTSSASKVQYVTINYAGQNSFGGIYIETCSPTIQNTTVQNSAYAGVRIIGTASPLITASTITSNPVGISIAYPATPSLTTLTISNNTGYAITMDAKVTLATVSGLTVTGNGSNAVQLVGNVDVTARWKNFGLTYYPTSYVYVGGPGTAVLTIDPGVTVKFANSVSIIVGNGSPGNLQAVGTSSQPIILTTVSGSPVPGSWEGIRFYNQTAAASKVQYVTLSYAGQNSFGGIYIDTCSPTIQNTTIQNSAYAGLRVVGTASPVISNSTITANPTGVSIASPATPSLTTLTISNNTGFAISMDAKVTLTTVSGLTVTGNGTNGIQLLGNVDVSTTWKNFGLTYYPSDSVSVGGSTTPILTISPGVTVKFIGGRALFVGLGAPGNLQSVGTAALPIVLTTTSATPVPGSWEGIRFYSAAVAASKITYTTISYAGADGYAGIYLNATSPTLDNVTLLNNANAGIRLDGATPTITNCVFSGNGAGMINSTPTVPAIARFNYWNSAGGPLGTGGQSVSTGVTYEPWLIGLPSQPQFFSSFTLKNRTFNPAIGINTTITDGTPLSGNWTITITNSGGTVVRTFSGTGLTATAVWDGKNASAVDQPDGTYTYELASVATGGTATHARGLSIIDRTKTLTITNLAVSDPFFSPNADGVQDTDTLTGSNSFDDTVFALNIKKSNGTVVRTNTSTGLNLLYIWDGKNGSGVVQADGVYTFEVTATNGTATATASITATLDNTLPTGSITVPASGSTVSNVYTNGITDVVVTGSNADANFKNWISDWGVGSTPTSFSQLASGTAPVTNASLGTWATGTLTNGTYTLRLQVWDKAGNKKTVQFTVTLGNFSASQNVLQINVGTGESVTYASIIPFNLTETITLKNAAGTAVRTLVNAVARTAGTANDPWNGKTAAGAVLPDGPYFYVATVTDGTHSMTWDLSLQYLNNYSNYNDQLHIQGWDPFNNLPMTFSYNFDQPGQVNIGLSPTGPVPTNCNAPNYCLAYQKYEESGPHTMTWAGVDGTGALRGDLHHIGIVTQRTNFSKNAVVVYGTKPSVTNVTVTPPVYGPSVGSQTVAFDLTSYQSQAVTVTVKFLNQASLSTLRTITLTGQTPGHKTLTWDGKGDNGMWVAPGFYVVTVTAVDAIGNSVSGQILTTIQY